MNPTDGCLKMVDVLGVGRAEDGCYFRVGQSRAKSVGQRVMVE